MFCGLGEERTKIRKKKKEIKEKKEINLIAAKSGLVGMKGYCGGPPSSLSRERPQFPSSLIDYSSDCLSSILLHVTKMNSLKLP